MTVEAIESAIDDLDATIGVKEAVSLRKLSGLHGSQDYAGLCRAVGMHMGMPNPVKIAFTSENERFAGHAMSVTDTAGRGTHGIAAQVKIPDNLPHYGTVAFQGYEVEMLLHANFERASAATAVTLLAHEMSHILLYSLRHSSRQSEKVTDLVPIVLGFGDIVAHGRNVVQREHANGVVRATTLTYGYLSDEELQLARRLVKGHLGARLRRRKLLKTSLGRAERRVAALSDRLSDLALVLAELDCRPALRFACDAEAVVALHAPGYYDNIHAELRKASHVVSETARFVRSLDRPSAQVARRIERYCSALEQVGEHIAQLETRVASDLRVVLRNQSWGRRLSYLARELRRSTPLKRGSSACGAV